MKAGFERSMRYVVCGMQGICCILHTNSLLLACAEASAHPLCPKGEIDAEGDQREGSAGTAEDRACSSKMHLVHTGEGCKGGQEENEADQPIDGRAGCGTRIFHRKG